MQAGFWTGEKAAGLFHQVPGGHGLVLAALHGQGRVLTDNPVNPRCAIAAVGNFLFCAGTPGRVAERMLRRVMGDHELWLVCAPDDWHPLLEHIAPVRMVKRMAFEPHQPEDEPLRSLLQAMPEGGRFQLIADEWIARCRQEKWSEDFVSAFSDKDFQRHGLGVLLMVEGQPVAGASSYVCYPGGMEVQVQTRDDMQGRGYATLAAAKLILLAHERGLSATWDAANPVSGHIAEKLGYRPAGIYQVAEMCRQQKNKVF